MFLESIAYQQQSPRLLHFHLARIECTIQHFAHLIPGSFSTKSSPSFSYFSYIKERLISYSPPHNGEMNRLYKGRFLYHPGNPGEETMEFLPYEIKSIATLHPIDSDIDYRFKYSERSALNALYEMRGEQDDILIIKDGMVSDSSYTNIVLFDGKEWVTPSTPLLKGVERKNLLVSGLIREKRIAYADLPHYRSFKLINALRPFSEVDEEPVSNISTLRKNV